MARTLTAAAAAEAARANGAFPRRILQLDFPSGTLYYSTEDLLIADGDPVDAEGRLISMGAINLSGEPGKAGSIGTFEIQLHDQDQFFKSKNETQPGIQTVDAFFYLWFEGTPWADRITDFGGTLTAPLSWDEKAGTFSATMKGFEHKYDVEIGEVATTELFPEMLCTECENNLIPIAYGDPVYRVPACVIDRPGQGILAAPFTIFDDTFTINSTAAEAGFDTGTITVIMGGGGIWEKITGSFGSGSSSVFTITDRGLVEGTTLNTGTTSGLFANEGFQYMTIANSDLTDPATSRVGHALAARASGVWFLFLISHWISTGANKAIIIEPSGFTFPSAGGNDYRLINQPGIVPVFAPGASVNEVGDWTYAANFLPSTSVVRIEAPIQVAAADGGRSTVWLEVNPAHYTVTLNDTTYNAALGRTSGNGLTTVTLDFTPVQVGLDDETLYMTMQGIGGFSDPADVMLDLLTNEDLGNVPAARVDSASFATAAALIPTKFSFALLDEKQGLHDMISELAYQANCIYFWDQGKAMLKRLVRPLVSGDSVLTITRDSYSNASRLSIQDTDVKDHVTELHGLFRPAIPAVELALIRKSADAITDFGIKRDEISFWAYQFPTSVALSTEFWLEYLLESNRIVTFTTWLNAEALQPGDTITLDIDTGSGVAIFDSVLAEVLGTQRQPGNLRERKMETITVTCVVKLYDYTVTPSAPSDITCVGNVVRNEFQRSGKLYLASTGGSRSLLVRTGANNRRDAAGSIQRPVTSGADPDQDSNVVINMPWLGHPPPC